jgi:hypothetical protein
LSVTTLRSTSVPLCKRFVLRKGEICEEKKPLPFLLFCEPEEVETIDELSSLLLVLEADPRRVIIRGRLVDGVDPTLPLRRRIHDAVRPVLEAPYVDQELSWLMIDMDKQQLPSGIDLLAQPLDAIDYLIAQLPQEFHDCTFHYQLSSSAGVFNTNEVSAHLFFWLQEPATSAKLKPWAEALNRQRKLIDASLFNTIQAHYTSKPIFPDRFTDPFEGRRSGLIRKNNDAVQIDYNIVEVERNRRTAHPQKSFERSGGYENILSQLGDGRGGDGFHKPLLRATSSYVATKGREVAESTRETLKDDLRDRIDSADQTNHTHQEIERYRSDPYLDALIDSAIEKYGDANAAAPYFDIVELPLEEAEAKLNQTIDEFSERFHHYWKAGIQDFVDPPSLAIKATAGLGKTSKLIARLIKSNALELGDIHYFVPTHNLSNQLINDLDEALDEEHFVGLLTTYTQRKSQLIAGRDKTDEDGEPLCEKADLAKQVAKLGLPVSTTLCKSGKKTCQFCPSSNGLRQMG